MKTIGRPPLVSVGIPTYNRCKYLKQVTDALFSQSYQNLEIIISDDCSSDETEKYCREIAQQDPRVIYIRQSQNIGSEKNFEYVFYRVYRYLYPSVSRKSIPCKNCTILVARIEIR